MRNVIMICFLFFAVGLVGCNPAVVGDPNHKKEEIDDAELEKLRDPNSDLQKSPPV